VGLEVADQTALARGCGCAPVLDIIFGLGVKAGIHRAIQKQAYNPALSGTVSNG
jgi:hypothetical protein